jgi:predicted RNA-binding Zn-ribbon protein involved in translation (DUF1610 family)
MNKVLASCSRCGYPIAVSSGGAVTPFCPNCNARTTLRIAAGTLSTSPWAFALVSVVAFSVGYVVGKKGR